MAYCVLCINTAKPPYKDQNLLFINVSKFPILYSHTFFDTAFYQSSLASMEFHLLPVAVFLTLVMVASHAAVPPQVYWNSVLPKTPMPEAIRSMLYPGFVDDKSTAVGVGKGGVVVNSGKGKPGGTSVNVGKGGVGVHTGNGKPGSGTRVAVGGKGKSVGVSAGKPGHRTNVNVGKGGVSVNTGHKGKPVYVGVGHGKVPFLYHYAATEDQLQDKPTVALFFLEKDLRAGTEMNLQFTRSTDLATLLPQSVSRSIPFSSSMYEKILSQFSVEPESVQAQSMKKTIKECEEPSIAGEEKFCATSLEAMIDFSTSKLGKSVQALSTEVGNDTHFRKYKIATGVRRLGGKTSVVCHKQDYVYAVFYCHKTDTTRAYTVPLVSADGSKVKAMAICHTDTSAWNPKHLAFQVLQVKPGSVPICHFLPEDHVVWVAK